MHIVGWITQYPLSNGKMKLELSPASLTSYLQVFEDQELIQSLESVESRLQDILDDSVIFVGEIPASQRDVFILDCNVVATLRPPPINVVAAHLPPTVRTSSPRKRATRPKYSWWSTVTYGKLDLTY